MVENSSILELLQRKQMYICECDYENASLGHEQDEYVLLLRNITFRQPPITSLLANKRAFVREGVLARIKDNAVLRLEFALMKPSIRYSIYRNHFFHCNVSTVMYTIYCVLALST